MTEYLGWCATTVFVLSYFFKRPQTLRIVQMTGAFIWVIYGFLIGAAPVVAANVLVVVAAAWTNSGLRVPEGGVSTANDEPAH
jgi:uncharacterized protein with PQ loop repeat